MEIRDQTNAPRFLRAEVGKSERSDARSEVAEGVEYNLLPSVAALTTLARALMIEIEELGQPLTHLSFSEQIARFEKELIRSALAQTGGKQSRAARLLGMKVSTLHRKIKMYKLVSLPITHNDLEQ